MLSFVSVFSLLFQPVRWLSPPSVVQSYSPVAAGDGVLPRWAFIDPAIPTSTIAAVKTDRVIGDLIDQCAWGPTPTRSRSGARRLAILARAAGASQCAWGPTPTRSRS